MRAFPLWRYVPGPDLSPGTAHFKVDGQRRIDIKSPPGQPGTHFRPDFDTGGHRLALIPGQRFNTPPFFLGPDRKSDLPGLALDHVAWWIKGSDSLIKVGDLVAIILTDGRRDPLAHIAAPDQRIADQRRSGVGGP